MVLVRVRQHDALDSVGVLAQVREVGEDEVDAGHVGVGEHQAAVDDQDATLDLEQKQLRPISPSPPRNTMRTAPSLNGEIPTLMSGDVTPGLWTNQRTRGAAAPGGRGGRSRY